MRTAGKIPIRRERQGRRGKGWTCLEKGRLIVDKAEGRAAVKAHLRLGLWLRLRRLPSNKQGAC